MTVPDAPAPASVSTSPWWPVLRVFDEPTRVFQALAARPRALLPVLLLVAVSGLVAFGTPDATLRRQAETQVTRMERQAPDRFTSEERERIVDRAASIGNRSIIFGGGTLFGLASLAVTALVLQLVFGATGPRSITFRKEFAVVAHAHLPQLLGAVVIVGLIAFLGMDQLTLSLGFLFDDESAPFLSRLGDQFTFFGAWKVVLLAVGNRVLTGAKGLGGPLALVGGLWAVVNVALAALLGIVGG